MVYGYCKCCVVRCYQRLWLLLGIRLFFRYEFHLHLQLLTKSHGFFLDQRDRTERDNFNVIQGHLLSISLFFIECEKESLLQFVMTILSSSPMIWFGHQLMELVSNVHFLNQRQMQLCIQFGCGCFGLANELSVLIRSCNVPNWMSRKMNQSLNHRSVMKGGRLLLDM